MKTLIIPPQDPTTRFLCGIYDTIPNKTVITGGLTKDELWKHIQDHDRVICCGHESPAGLLDVGQFPDAYPYGLLYFSRNCQSDYEIFRIQGSKNG
jgi:hypothetical protein